MHAPLRIEADGLRQDSLPDFDPLQADAVEGQGDGRTRPVEDMALPGRLRFQLGPFGIGARRPQDRRPHDVQMRNGELTRKQPFRLPGECQPLDGQPDARSVRDLDIQQAGQAVVAIFDRADRHVERTRGAQLVEGQLDQPVLEERHPAVSVRHAPRGHPAGQQCQGDQGDAHQNACPIEA